jgi:hypothetical protein
MEDQVLFVSWLTRRDSPIVDKESQMRRLLFVSIWFLSLSLCDIPAQSLQGKSDDIVHASMYELVALPNKFDGRRIVVTGFMFLGPRSTELFVHQEDEKHEILENGISLVRTKQMQDQKAELNFKYVRIVGRFKVRDSGIPPFTGGVLTDIEGCMLWSDPEHPFHDRLKELP